MKVFVNENRAGFNGELLGVKFDDGVAEVNDHDQILVEMLEKYYSVSRGVVSKPVKAVEEAPVEAVAVEAATAVAKPSKAK